MRNESVILRGTAYLHCRTQSVEQPQIRWVRNDINIGNSAKIVIFFVEFYILFVFSICPRMELYAS